jgi:CRISPR/Cas system CSM-associated protein Csm2 small subunit
MSKRYVEVDETQKALNDGCVVVNTYDGRSYETSEVFALTLQDIIKKEGLRERIIEGVWADTDFTILSIDDVHKLADAILNIFKEGGE